MATQPIDTELRKTGIGVVGDVPWGTHFFMFYETKEDLLDTLVPYFKAGLETGEFCFWLVSEPLTEEKRGMRCAKPSPNSSAIWQTAASRFWVAGDSMFPVTIWI